MTRYVPILVVVAAMVTGVPSLLTAGECVDSEASYVAMLEQGPGEPGFGYAVYCLGSNPTVMGRLWAGPNSAARLEAMRSDSLGSRVAAAVSALLTSAWAESADNRHTLIRIAARRGISRLDSLDVFTLLVGPSEKPYFGIYEDMAILQDCRSVDFVRSRYKQLRRGSPEAYPDEILDLLSCLYHIPCDRALQAAVELEARETDGKLRERLKRVIDRE